MRACMSLHVLVHPAEPSAIGLVCRCIYTTVRSLPGPVLRRCTICTRNVQLWQNPTRAPLPHPRPKTQEPPIIEDQGCALAWDACDACDACDAASCCDESPRWNQEATRVTAGGQNDRERTRTPSHIARRWASTLRCTRCAGSTPRGCGA
jgi:hypothetical protein